MCRINPKVDIVFKKLFGSEENKDILLSLINSILPQNEQITEIELANPYNIADYIDGKISILDIKAKDEDGKLYDIEMQVGEQGYYGKRSLYYWGKTYTGQIDTGEMYSKLKKTIVISILDFKYFKDDERVHRIIRAKDVESNEEYQELDCFELHFIELKKFSKELSALTTTLDRWITFLTKAYEYEKGNVPEELSKDPAVKKAIEKLDVIYLDAKERLIYEQEQKQMWDEQEKMRTAEAKGVEKRNMEIVRTGKENNVPFETISLLTGLTIEEIEKLIIEVGTPVT